MGGWVRRKMRRRLCIGRVGEKENETFDKKVVDRVLRGWMTRRIE